LSLIEPPKSLLVVGGGVIGIELATVFNGVGTKVTVVEFLSEILPNVDPELADLLRAKLESQGISIYTGAAVQSFSSKGDEISITVSGSYNGDIIAEKVLVAVGRKPNTTSLGLEALGVEMVKGRIVVDKTMKTNIPGLWAIGDCASPIMLAHVATKEGELAAENILGRPVQMDYGKVPGAIYTTPEIAWVGLSEKEAMEKGHKIRVGRFPLAYNGKNLVMGGEGIFKTIIDEKYGELLGVHLMGPRATDIIGLPVLALNMEATANDLAEIIHPHPTVGEALGESLLDSLGRAIHK
jgi:dihydrolipoamide dehydrogenase